MGPVRQNIGRRPDGATRALGSGAAAMKPTVYVMLHMPRTAGTNVVMNLAKHFRENERLPVYPEDLGGFERAATDNTSRNMGGQRPALSTDTRCL